MSSDPILPPGSDPGPSFQPTVQNGPAGPTSSGVAPNIAAGLCALFPLIGGLIFIIIEKKNQFVRFWAMQSLFFFGFGVAVNILFSFILLPTLGRIPVINWLVFLLLFLIGLGLLLLWIVTVIMAFIGKEWEIPVLGKLARQQLRNLPTT